MTAKEKVLQKLGEQKQMVSATGPEVLAEWLESLTRLYRVFAAWLAESVAEKLLSASEIPIAVQEERLGRYLAPSLKIRTPREQTIHVQPKARLVVGSFGRVDFDCGPKKVILVRTQRDQWQFARLGLGGWSFEELTETSFWETLRYLLS